MDIIALTSIKSPWDYAEPSIVIAINGIKLIELLAEFEKNHTTEIAGGYGHIPKNELDSQLFLGKEPEEWVDVLTCECGILDCWPFQVKIQKTKNIISWVNFQQPHRQRESAGGFWDYKDFGPFVFNCEQYIAQVKNIT